MLKQSPTPVTLNQARLSAFRLSLKRPKNRDTIFDEPDSKVVAQVFKQRRRSFFIIENKHQLSHLKLNGFLVEKTSLIENKEFEKFSIECPNCHHHQIRTDRIMSCSSCGKKITAG